MAGVALPATSRKRPRDIPRSTVVRRNVHSVFAAPAGTISLARRRPSKQQRTSTNPTPTIPQRREYGTERGEDTSEDEAHHYRSMMQELATRAKLREKKQLAAQRVTEAAEYDDDDEQLHHDAYNQQQQQEEQEETEEEEDEDRAEDDEVEEEEEGDATVEEQVAAAEGAGSDVQSDEDGDIDDISQPSTLLQSAVDAEEDVADSTFVSLTSSSLHPELLSSDRFLSHFSHHRTLPADLLTQLTANSAQLLPLPHVDGIPQQLYGLNLSLLKDERIAEQPHQQLPLTTGQHRQEAEEKERRVEEALGVPLTGGAVWLRDLHVRPKIVERWQAIASKQRVKQRKKLSSAAAAHSTSSAVMEDDLPHPLQRVLLPLLNTYRDVVYPCLSPSTASSTFTPATHTSVIQAYCLHVVNHVVRAREAVLRHNTKLSDWLKRQQEKRDKERLERQQQKQQAKLLKQPSTQQRRNRHATHSLADDGPQSPLPPEYRDQGFTRCRVLILLPYAHFAYKVINCLLSLLPTTGRVDILNRRRYESEFSGEGLVAPDSTKPADYRYLMTGELNDAFRIGLSLGSRGVRLYAPFQASDVIVASPLGIKLLLDGGEGHDWLSSVEVLVLDQCDVFGMQNWQHVESCLQALNQLPTGQIHAGHSEQAAAVEGGLGGGGRVKQVEMDITRVKNYFLDNNARYYRQTIILANHLSTDIHHLAIHELHNYAGLVLFRPLYAGVLTRIQQPLQASTQRQIFNRFHVSSLQQMHNDRFDYFTSHIFPTLKANYSSSGHLLILVPSYGDFLRLRNHFKSKHYNYAALSEYSSGSNISRHRSNFYHGRVKFLLMTERFYFYRRYLIRGVGHLVFYALPQYSWCYEELVNAMGMGVGAAANVNGGSEGAAVNGGGGGGLCVALYCVYDGRELERIVGTQRSLSMLSDSSKSTYMFC